MDNLELLILLHILSIGITGVYYSAQLSLQNGGFKHLYLFKFKTFKELNTKLPVNTN